jgi:hypothetical protein
MRPVIAPHPIPPTPGTGCEPVASICQEKLRLRMQFAAEARRFLLALNGCLARKNRSPATQLPQETSADEARRACEQAMDALEAHRISHGC